MKNILRKSRLNRYYYLNYEFKTPIERQIQRLKHDPIRLYDGTNEKVSISSVKGARLG